NIEDGVLSNLVIKDTKENEVVFDYSRKGINFDYLLKCLKLFNQYIKVNLNEIRIESERKGSFFDNFRYDPEQSKFKNQLSLSLIFETDNELISLLKDPKIEDSVNRLNEFSEYNFDDTIFYYDQSLGITKENEAQFLQQYMTFPNAEEFFQHMFHGEDALFNDPYNWLSYFRKVFDYYFRQHSYQDVTRNSSREVFHWEFFLNVMKNASFDYPFLEIVRTDKIQKNNNSEIFFVFVVSLFFNVIVRGLSSFREIFWNYSNSNSFNYLQVTKGVQSRVYIIEKENVFINLLNTFSTLGNTNESSEEFLNKWLKVFKLADKVKLERKEGVLLIPYLIRDGNEINLADVGYGMNQIMSLIFKIFIVANNNDVGFFDVKFNIIKPSILFIEEPEANLHPDFQSKLADMFVDASNKFNIQFFIETHSEYLIRKLQYLTAKKKIKPEDSVIYYFNHPNEVAKGAEQVKEIKILEDGSLSDDFGTGFFDEADKIALELYNLQRKKTMRN
ncbi:MAG: DUF3696 domain-containing protein, partial [Bacteroidetes bacterium]|nr:DUF3696 domain-containing protein [Bacteroidota bacterium]